MPSRSFCKERPPYKGFGVLSFILFTKTNQDLGYIFCVWSFCNRQNKQGGLTNMFGNGCGSGGCEWMIILLILCCCFGNKGGDCCESKCGGGGFGGGGCEWIIWILILMCCCGGGGGGRDNCCR